MDRELVCNFRKCRKRVGTYAWVTSCSHILCDEDGNREFNINKSIVCPACESSLSGKYDIIHADLQPTEQYKSMVLAGQKPEAIMDICTRALAFWTYQAHQESSYQEYIATKAKERNHQLEGYYEQIINRSQSELTNLKTQVTAQKKEMEQTKKLLGESQQKVLEKSRQYQKLQTLYDAVRRKMISPSSFAAADLPPNLTPRARTSFDISITRPHEDILRPQESGDNVMLSQGRHCPAEREFIFRPNATPLIGSTSESDFDILNDFQNGKATPNGKNYSRRKPQT